jgi:Ser/Thr protein kinase RdoA (MazF antagonist)
MAGDLRRTSPALHPMSSHPFVRLTPDVVIAAVEKLGLRCDGRILALNSYENRVYQVGVEEDSPVVAKFYRPARWSTPAILEEHEFALELAAAEIPVIAPLEMQGRTLFEHEAFRYAVYPRRGGHWPELGSARDREWMGRFLARIHAVGARRRFQHRHHLDWRLFGRESAQYLLREGWLPDHITTAYETLAGDLLRVIEQRFAECQPLRQLRLHGDCHSGNVLWTDDGPHFVDLDDCLTGPAIQDLWMLLSGPPEEMSVQLADILDGYRQFADFDYAELRLIEPLRTLRMMHYAAWLARRWDDPAFPQAFPWFGGIRYWEQHVLDLREQLAAMEQPVLRPDR